MRNVGLTVLIIFIHFSTHAQESYSEFKDPSSLDDFSVPKSESPNLLSTTFESVKRFTLKALCDEATFKDLVGLGSDEEKKKTEKIAEDFYNNLATLDAETQKQFLQRQYACSSLAILYVNRLTLFNASDKIPLAHIDPTGSLITDAEKLCQMHGKTLLAPKLEAAILFQVKDAKAKCARTLAEEQKKFESQ